MSLTALDPNTALLVVDLQKGIIGLPSIHPIGVVVERARALLDAFRARRLPVVLINAAGVAPGRTEQPARVPSSLPEGFTDFIPELDRQPGDIVVTKRTWGAFATTDLEARLKAIGVTQVVVVGGFNVTLALDAMTDIRAEAHDYSLRNVFPRLGETGTAQEIVQLLQTRSA
ncbi:MAG TPA: isochorismatase family protein [Caulobacteraceae bacterium]